MGGDTHVAAGIDVHCLVHRAEGVEEVQTLSPSHQFVVPLEHEGQRDPDLLGGRLVVLKAGKDAEQAKIAQAILGSARVCGDRRRADGRNQVGFRRHTRTGGPSRGRHHDLRHGRADERGTSAGSFRRGAGRLQRDWRTRAGVGAPSVGARGSRSLVTMFDARLETGVARQLNNL